MEETDSRGRTARIEAASWIVVGLLAFLARDNPRLVYPNVLYLFLLLLASSLGVSLTVRLWPQKTWTHALTLIAGFATIAGIQEWSGGEESNLWVLYLMPMFNAAILLEGHALAWTAFGACAANAAVDLALTDGWSPAASFGLALKTGILASAAGATWVLSRREREAGARARRQRAEIDRLESSLKATAEARERERGVAEIAAGGAAAVHDLGAPLMVIRAYTRLHLDHDADASDLERDLKRIEAAAGFCQSLVMGLLARAGGPTAPRSLKEVAETALSLTEPLLETRRVDVACRYPDKPLAVNTSGQDLERVLLNLIGNAAKVLSPGGRVTIRIGAETGRAFVAVEDDGPGLPSELLPRLFQPFATGGKGGTGLGLYASRETARRLGGDLTAENRPEGGARFTLRLPLVDAAKASATAS